MFRVALIALVLGGLQSTFTQVGEGNINPGGVDVRLVLGYHLNSSVEANVYADEDDADLDCYFTDGKRFIAVDENNGANCHLKAAKTATMKLVVANHGQRKVNYRYVLVGE